MVIVCQGSRTIFLDTSFLSISFLLRRIFQGTRWSGIKDRLLSSDINSPLYFESIFLLQENKVVLWRIFASEGEAGDGMDLIEDGKNSASKINISLFREKC